MATEAVEASNRTISRAAARAAERFGDEPALGLVGLGVEPGDRVSLLANTRPEWTYASLAISRVGAVVVPIYPTNSPEECAWVAGNSQSVAIICEDASQVAKIEAVRDRLPEL